MNSLGYGLFWSGNVIILDIFTRYRILDLYFSSLNANLIPLSSQFALFLMKSQLIFIFCALYIKCLLIFWFIFIIFHFLTSF